MYGHGITDERRNPQNPEYAALMVHVPYFDSPGYEWYAYHPEILNLLDRDKVLDKPYDPPKRQDKNYDSSLYELWTN